MKVSVTQKHIDQGVKGSTTHDPVALAMKDAGAIRVWVSPVYLGWTDANRKTYSVPTPDEVLRFMKVFDNGAYVQPFEFEVRQ